jgi:hypothetical protein
VDGVTLAAAYVAGPEGGVPHDIKEYPDVGHSFMND